MKSFLLAIASAGLALAQVPMPNLQISMNGSRATELMRGSPVLIDAYLMNSMRQDRSTGVPPLHINPSDAGWADKTRFRVTRDGVESETCSFTLMTPQEREVTLEPGAFVAGVWLIPADQTIVLPAGQYEIVAELEIRESSGWNGTIRSVPVAVTVTDEPEQFTPAQQIARGLLVARAEGLAGRVKDVSEGLVQLAAAHPDSVRVLRALAEALDAAGMPIPAYNVALKALEKYYDQYPAGREVPASLLALRNRLWAAITDQP